LSREIVRLASRDGEGIYKYESEKFPRIVVAVRKIGTVELLWHPENVVILITK